MGASERKLVAFVGGGRQWLIGALTPEGSDFWAGRWEVGDTKRSDRRIWRVKYGRIARRQPTLEPPQVDIANLKRRLTVNLTAIGEFARKQEMDYFAAAFDTGLELLTTEGALDGTSDAFSNDALPPVARQLLGAARAAWVFGGMGSWNDVGFDGPDQDVYERLTDELYELLNEAIIAAANTSMPPRPG